MPSPEPLAPGPWPVPVVGIDLVRVADVTASIARFGERYLRRVFTDAERAYAERGTTPERDRRLAARFAAKEATLKVLQPARHWFDWRCLEVRRAPCGACAMRLYGPAAQMARQRGLGELAMSLSHEEPFAVAVVTGLRWPGADPHAPDSRTADSHAPDSHPAASRTADADSRAVALFGHRSEND